MADNESIHGSLGQSYENPAEIGISMVVQNKPEIVRNEELVAVEI